MTNKWKYLVAIALICLFVLLLPGCSTSFDEWSGNMANSTGPHVQGYSVDNQAAATTSQQPTYWTSGGAGAPPAGQPPAPPYSPPPAAPAKQ